MRLAIARATVEEVTARLAGRDPRAGEDARAAVEWLTSDEDCAMPLVFTRRRLQLFLWYELPRKWLIEPEEHLAAAEALASFFEDDWRWFRSGHAGPTPLKAASGVPPAGSGAFS